MDGSPPAAQAVGIAAGGGGAGTSWTTGGALVGSGDGDGAVDGCAGAAPHAATLKKRRNEEVCTAAHLIIRRSYGRPDPILAPCPWRLGPVWDAEMETVMTLSGKQTRHLRALGHHLDPLVQLGKSGLTDGAKDAVNAALDTHELVKVRVGTECPDEPAALATRLGPELKADVAQRLGRTILLYRRHPKKPKIKLPAPD